MQNRNHPIKWEEVLPKTKVHGFTPVTASKSKVKRKEELCEILKKKIGNDLPRIKEMTKEKPLAIDVCYYLLESSNAGQSKKDLDNLLKILLDVLSEKMGNGQNLPPGLGLIRDDGFVYKIKCEKKVNFRGREGFDLKILRQV